MIKKILSVLIAGLIFTAAQAQGQQATEDAAVLDVIHTLFKAMQLGDSALARTVFADEFTSASIFKDKENNPVLRRESSAERFLSAIRTHKGVWYEEIWNVKIQTDGDLAQVWCDYAFYIDTTFNHCGVDAFQLHKAKAGWKIFHLADTRRKADCVIPQTIQDKHR